MVSKGFYGISQPLLLPKGFEKTLKPGFRLLGERARSRVMGLFRRFFFRTGFFVGLAERTDGIGQFPRICHGVIRRLDSLDRLLEILRGSGSQFDPDIVQVFLKLLDDGTIERIRNQSIRQRSAMRWVLSAASGYSGKTLRIPSSDFR